MKTIVVMGCHRGGTSMVAAVLSDLGVFMGNVKNTRYYEDGEMQGKSPMQPIIERRNIEHKLWGWKYPYTKDKIDEIYPLLRKPHFILVFRDIFAIAETQAKQSGNNYEHFMKDGLEETRKLYNIYCKYKNEIPTHCISIEKIARDKVKVITDIADFIGLNVNETALNRIDFKNGYRANMPVPNLSLIKIPNGYEEVYENSNLL